jgi:hypothetical protein
MVSKPCARDGCTELVTATVPYILARKKYHSIKCQVDAKKAAGWKPASHFTRDMRHRGGVASGKRTHAIWHRRKLETAVRACVALIPKHLEASLSARDLALMKVLVGRAFELGRRREHQILEQRRRRDERIEQKGAAA